ncbi:hypothetical protein PF010_g14227 [Phytophthora fragariae]|uniref:SUN domain-containing protein n=1 Tax=Phytophthora fragariae TaxID=53985 RepID=A0A6G0KXG4_9STRA|nr:hypothetical protein PF010_g14227 [Phytophthora fragariae]
MRNSSRRLPALCAVVRCLGNSSSSELRATRSSGASSTLSASTTSKRPLGTSSSGSTSSSASSVSALGSSGSARGSVGRCTRRGVGRRVGCRDTVHANAIAKEKFSSPIKHFLVLCSVNYPTDTWLVLGKFTAAHANGEQTFQLDTQQHVRYIKFRFLSHYGSDCHCILSQLRCSEGTGSE